jgi:hypothetical protein
MSHLASAFRSTPVFNSRQSSVRGSQNGLQVSQSRPLVGLASSLASCSGHRFRKQQSLGVPLLQRTTGVSGTVMMAKKGLHPEWYDEATVTCNGEEVLKVGGTKSSYIGEAPPTSHNKGASLMAGWCIFAACKGSAAGFACRQG